MAKDRINMLYDFFNSFLSQTKTRMTKVFPIRPMVARMEYVARVKVVIPGGGWFGAAVDELEMFIFAGRMKPLTAAL